MGPEQPVKPSASPRPLRAVITPSSRAVLCLWAALPGVFLAPFVFWQGPGWGLAFCGAWGGLVWFLGYRAGHFSAEVGHRALVLRIEGLFPVRRVLPRQSITSALAFRTPLLRLAGAAVLILFTPGCWTVLPGIPAGQAEEFCAVLLGDKPQEAAP